MVLAGGALVLVELLLVVYCVLSVITTPADQVRHLPKAAWLLLVVVLPLAGGVAWLLSGRSPRPSSLPSSGRGVSTVHDRPGGARASAPDDDAAFLQQLRDRAEAQRARREAAERDEDRRPGEPS